MRSLPPERPLRNGRRRAGSKRHVRPPCYAVVMDGRSRHAELVERLIAMVEAGTAPWQKPWDASSGLPPWPRSAISGRPYRGMNFLALLSTGLADPRWCTPRQAERRGWRVRSGARASTVWFFAKISPRDTRTGKKYIVQRLAQVFNIGDLDGPPAHDAPSPVDDTYSAAAEVMARSGAEVFHGADRACYLEPTDSIHLPDAQTFRGIGDYYATALHELAHWTGHRTRLDRRFGRFGDPEYAREELRAEIASLMLSSLVGVPHDPGPHASYVASWLAVLRRDRREIVRAASDAQRIVDWLCASEEVPKCSQAPISSARVRIARRS